MPFRNFLGGWGWGGYVTRVTPPPPDPPLQLDQERKSLTLEFLHSVYPKWTHVYTDGSATDATRDGGGGVLIGYREEDAAHSVATGRYSTNYKAEAEALEKAARELHSNLPRAHEKIVIFTDAISVLQALEKNDKELNELALALSTLSSKPDVTLQWVPAHCGVRGNETADRLAKEGGL
ncbi:hypothetical protein V1264_023272 [Littorina saxatilis]|uniref:ribonuclease H n=1 Tax=Littorina saxatilis TaxID=31220 RepID=A0AAN9GAA1_9CAEN